MVKKNEKKRSKRMVEMDFTPGPSTTKSKGKKPYVQMPTFVNPRQAVKKAHKDRQSRKLIAIGDGGAKTGTTILKNKFPKKCKGKFVTPWSWKSNGTNHVPCLVGGQGTNTLRYAMGYGTEMGAAYTICAGALNNPTGLSVPNTFNEIYFNDCVTSTQYVNTSNLNTTMWIYTMTCRQTEAVGAASINPITLATADTTLTYGNYGGTNYSINTPGWTPYKSPELVKMWKIRDCKKITLTAGEKYVHKTVLQIKRAFRADQLNITTGSGFISDNLKSLYFRGITTVQFIIAEGGMSHGVTDTTQITYALGNIDTLQDITYRGHWAQGTYPVVFEQDTLPGASGITGGALIAEEAVFTSGVNPIIV